jgi:uncharacterized protein YebE (UPF0316 family)
MDGFLSTGAGPLDWYAWIVLPILIFLARVIDVTLGTLRIIFTSRGQRNLAPLLGFVEVFIWVAALAQLVKSAQNIVAYLGYAAGFAAGNYVGMWIEGKLALGTVTVRAILRRDPQELIEQLKSANFGVTVVEGRGSQGSVNIVYTTVKRRDLPSVTAIFHQCVPGAFLAVEEVRATEQGVFPNQHRKILDGAFPGRKSK